MYHKLDCNARVLFVLKYRENCWGDYSQGDYGSHGHLSSGLFNSATFVKDMLREAGVEAKLVQVPDNNAIDREVTLFKPTHVIIEAFWVVPEKFEVLTRLHPKVKWIIRNHSDVPFLSNEGIAVDWLIRYVAFNNVSVSNNSPRAQAEVTNIIDYAYPHFSKRDLAEKVIYLPNYYPNNVVKYRHPRHRAGEVHIGCFGAIRPLKNQLLQAIAALDFAQKMNFRLYFHINASRIEGRGDPILKNIRELFKHLPHHKLVEHPWMNREDFLKVVADMDICMQVSFSETFNIVGADAVSQGVALVCSEEIPWATDFLIAKTDSSEDMIEKLKRAWHFKNLPWTFHAKGLRRYAEKSRTIWLKYFCPGCPAPRPDDFRDDEKDEVPRDFRDEHPEGGG